MNRKTKIAALIVATLFPLHAFAANSWGTDRSDLWWIPEESGWGANIVHQNDMIFMTLFVYGEGGVAKWYVGPAIQSDGGSDALTFTGALYETKGPYFGGPFDPNGVTSRQVGSVTILFSETGAVSPTYPDGPLARLSFSVDGISQTKWIQRQTFRNNDPTGYYVGATIASNSGCGTGSGSFEIPTHFTFSQGGPGIVMVASRENAPVCTYSGAYNQAGKLGSFVGTVSCANGLAGSVQVFEIEAGHVGFSARYLADYGGGCTESGRIGGVKR
jgi:hypothetical protein